MPQDLRLVPVARVLISLLAVISVLSGVQGADLEALVVLDPAVDCGGIDDPASGQVVSLEAGEYEFIAVDGAWTPWGCDPCNPPDYGWYWHVHVHVQALGTTTSFGSANPRFATMQEAEQYYVFDPGTRGTLTVPSTSDVYFWIADRKNKLRFRPGRK